MKVLLVGFLLLSCSFLNADTIKATTIACPEEVHLQNVTKEVEFDYFKLNSYANKYHCDILDKNSEVEAIGYDPATSKELIIKIINKKTGKELYIRSRAVQIERSGKKNNFRF